MFNPVGSYIGSGLTSAVIGSAIPSLPSTPATAPATDPAAATPAAAAPAAATPAAAAPATAPAAAAPATAPAAAPAAAPAVATPAAAFVAPAAPGSVVAPVIAPVANFTERYMNAVKEQGAGPGSSTYIILSMIYDLLTKVPFIPTITGLPTFPSITGIPSAPTALSMPTISFAPIIPTTNVADIQTANPLRIQSMNNVIDKQTAYNAQMPILQSAKIPVEVLTPMKKYLDDEVSWWKTNILLTVKQVQDRTAIYTQAIKALTAELEKNIINTLGAMSPEDYTVAINILTPQQPTKSGFADMPAAAAAPAPASPPITVVDMGKIKEESKTLNDNTAAENTLYNAENLNYWDYTKAAFSSVFRFNIILSIIFFTFTFIIASYVANDNLHRRPAFRVLKFIGTILFTMFSPFGYLFMWGLIIYYIYRGISYSFFNNINNRIIALAILPLVEMDAEGYNNANLLTKYLYVYTLGGSQSEQINSVVKDRGALYEANRIACTKNTQELQNQLKNLR